jgi:molybdopterin synthase catalytic subunit
MSTQSRIRVQSEAFDVGAVIEELCAGNPAVGAITSFVGLVRDVNDDVPVTSMTLEHYPGMTEKALEAIVADAKARWDLIDVALVHRIGELRPADPIVLVAVASAHRGDAFQACEFIMDFLKTRAPFWKKEENSQRAKWVESRASDDRAAHRWKS